MTDLVDRTKEKIRATKVANAKVLVLMRVPPKGGACPIITTLVKMGDPDENALVTRGTMWMLPPAKTKAFRNHPAIIAADEATPSAHQNGHVKASRLLNPASPFGRGGIIKMRRAFGFYVSGMIRC